MTVLPYTSPHEDRLLLLLHARGPVEWQWLVTAACSTRSGVVSSLHRLRRLGLVSFAGGLHDITEAGRRHRLLSDRMPARPVWGKRP